MRAPRPGPGGPVAGLVVLALTAALLVVAAGAPPAADTGGVRTGAARSGIPPAAATNATQQFAGALNRLVTLVAAAGGSLLALVWARVALSWFSNDVSKKVQAKDRARDALIGSLVFTAAVSGLAWALAQWVISGT